MARIEQRRINFLSINLNWIELSNEILTLRKLHNVYQIVLNPVNIRAPNVFVQLQIQANFQAALRHRFGDFL